MPIRYRHQWTQAKLFRAMWDAARRDSTKIVRKRIGAEETHTAYITFDERKIHHRLRITVDPSLDSYVKSVLHELLHYVLRELGYVFPPELEEAIVVGIQDVLWPKIRDNPRRMRRWSGLIEEKIRTGEAE